jgi:hypothetical protein
VQLWHNRLYADGIGRLVGVRVCMYVSMYVRAVYVLCFVDRASLYNLVNKYNKVHNSV